MIAEEKGVPVEEAKIQTKVERLNEIMMSEFHHILKRERFTIEDINNEDIDEKAHETDKALKILLSD